MGHELQLSARALEFGTGSSQVLLLLGPSEPHGPRSDKNHRLKERNTSLGEQLATMRQF